MDSSESSGLSSISSESVDDFASYSDLSSDESVTSFDEDLFDGKVSSRQIDSDAESVGYLDARLALDLIDFDDFHDIRYPRFRAFSHDIRQQFSHLDAIILFITEKRRRWIA